MMQRNPPIEALYLFREWLQPKRHPVAFLNLEEELLRLNIEPDV